jgi:hypothetical protein
MRSVHTRLVVSAYLGAVALACSAPADTSGGSGWSGTTGGSCTPRSFFAATSSVPKHVATGGGYSVLCDYGVVTNSIEVDGASGTCNWKGWVGTAGRFDCVAGPTSGFFAVSCRLDSIAPDDWCERRDPVGTLQVAAPTPPPPPPADAGPPPPQDGGSTIAKYGTGMNTAPKNITNVTGGGPTPDPSTGILVTTYGATGNGSTDDTSAIQSAANAAQSQGKPLVFPAASAFFKISSAIDLHGSVMGAGGYPTIRMFGADGNGNHRIFNLTGVSGAVITGLQLDGHWDGSTRPSGEYDHIIAVESSSNITIADDLIENPMGDGIYLGTTGTTPSTNILVNHVDITNPYRCIVALISSKDVVILNSNLTKLDDYVSPIDFEPNKDPDGDFNAEVAYDHFHLPNDKHGNNQWGTPSYAGNAIGAWQNNQVSNPGGNIYLHDNWGLFGDGFWGGAGSEGTSAWGMFYVSNNTPKSM